MENRKHAFPKIGFSEESIVEMLEKVASFKMEERDLALDKFRKIDKIIGENAEAFWANGPIAIQFLNSACNSSAYLGDLAKEVMKLVKKMETPSQTDSVNQHIDVSQIAKNIISERRAKKEGQEDESNSN